MGDNKANLANVNIDYATTSRDHASYEGEIFEWAIIGQTSQTLILAMQRLPEMTCNGTSVGRALEVALSGQSPSVAVDDVAAFVDLEHDVSTHSILDVEYCITRIFRD